MQTVKIADLKNNLSAYLRIVRGGQEVVICQHQIGQHAFDALADGAGVGHRGRLIQTVDQLGDAIRFLWHDRHGDLPRRPGVRPGDR